MSDKLEFVDSLAKKRATSAWSRRDPTRYKRVTIIDKLKFVGHSVSETDLSLWLEMLRLVLSGGVKNGQLNDLDRA